MRMSINNGSIIIRLEFYFIPLIQKASGKNQQNIALSNAKKLRLQTNILGFPVRRTTY